MLNQYVRNTMQSLIQQQKHSLIQLCFDKVVGFLHEVSAASKVQQSRQADAQGSQGINMQVYVTAIHSIMHNL